MRRSMSLPQTPEGFSFRFKLSSQWPKLAEWRGETPNLAARLQTLASPDELLICPMTRRLIGGAFELEELGPQALKGFAMAVPVWRVSGTRSVESRFEARASELTPMVGREQEVALLLERWQQAKDREGQVVLLSGEP